MFSEECIFLFYLRARAGLLTGNSEAFLVLPSGQAYLWFKVASPVFVSANQQDLHDLGSFIKVSKCDSMH